jgi:hypothetical protein
LYTSGGHRFSYEKKWRGKKYKKKKIEMKKCWQLLLAYERGKHPLPSKSAPFPIKIMFFLKKIFTNHPPSNSANNNRSGCQTNDRSQQ